MDKDSGSSGWKVHEDPVKSPTVNYINITRRPEGGIVNVEMKRQPGPQIGGDNLRSTHLSSRGSSLPTSLNDLTDPIALFDNSSRLKSLLRQHQQKFGPTGFSISSPNESSAKIDSDGTRLVINPPPLPVHVVERHGSGGGPYHVVIHHPRSQSTESVVVNTSPGGSTTTRTLSSPRSNSTGNVSILETKFPSLRAVSPFGQRSFLISSPLFGEGGTRLSLFDRFNEHAPPSFFDSRLRSASHPENLHVSKMTVIRDGSQKPQVHNIPIKIEGRDSKSDKPSKPSVVYKIPINLVSKNTDARNSQQPPLPVQVSVKPKGISIPIITHRTTPSDAEQKLAALTKQLEDEMRSAGAPRTPAKIIVTPQPQPMKLPARSHSPDEESATEDIKVPVPTSEAKVPLLEETAKVPVIESKITESSERKPDIVEVSSEVPASSEAKSTTVDNQVEKLAQELKSQLEESAEDQHFGVCYKCNSDVTSEACKALGNLYHSSCFQCSACNKPLKGKSFFDVQGMIYCDEDFMMAGYRRLASNCHACRNDILDLVLQALGRSFHPACFKCCQCSKNLENEVFTVDANDRIFCVDDYYQIHSTKCHACGKVIMPPKGENGLVKVAIKEKNYHVDCLKCNGCGLALASRGETRCFPIGDEILCQTCHDARKQS